MGKKRHNNDAIIWKGDFGPAMNAQEHWRTLLQNLYVSVFDWQGLPDTVDPLFMEMQLMLAGRVCMFEEHGSLVCLPAQPAYRLNIYGYPAASEAYGMNGFVRRVSIDESVLCYDNITHSLAMGTINYYAGKLANLDCTIDVNVDNQKTPYIIKTTESQKLSVQNLFSRIDSFARRVLAFKDLNDGMPLDVIQTPAPYVTDKLQMQKQKILAEALNYMGVFSGISSKEERSTVGENVSNVGYIKSARDARLKPRQLFADLVNKKFGLNVSVDFTNIDMENIAVGLFNGDGYRQVQEKVNALKGGDKDELGNESVNDSGTNGGVYETGRVERSATNNQ